ncbi:hypothetical protein BCR34DRAFT_302136 [Clohesyomyces aquaticus]|uniref:Uncharacterized protein n=1 Tax=Clohesyomyces aquaticus TaxID=1231657 RepID=A0A1Y1ZPY0_9PLEO|nr:hypothetical protein BCR34DRAFT_302136 [Clohesyomyces aquaticus]
MWWKDMKMRMWIIVGVIVLLIIIIVPSGKNRLQTSRAVSLQMADCPHSRCFKKVRLHHTATCINNKERRGGGNSDAGYRGELDWYWLRIARVAMMSRSSCMSNVTANWERSVRFSVLVFHCIRFGLAAVGLEPSLHCCPPDRSCPRPHERPRLRARSE